jgi:hypothetical protein
VSGLPGRPKGSGRWSNTAIPVNRTHRLRDMKAEGKCRDCGKPVEPGRSRCGYHLEKNAEYQMAHKAKVARNRATLTCGESGVSQYVAGTQESVAVAKLAKD